MEDKLDGPYGTLGEMKNACRILVVKSEGKRPLVRPRSKWKDSSKMVSKKADVDSPSIPL
jgi:hypothetical protein